MPSDTPCQGGPDLDAVARDYAADQLSVAAICSAHSISQSQFYRHASEQGWPLRQVRIRAAKVYRPRNLTNRLALALDEKMAQFENRLVVNGSSATAADAERDARTLSTLLRLFERLKTLQDQEAVAGCAAFRPPSRPASQTKDTDAPDPLRGELARRLERLRGQIGG